MHLLFSVIFLLCTSVFAKDVNVSVNNVIKDDEGIKVIATNSKNKMVIYYLSQGNTQYNLINQKLQSAKSNKNKIKLNVTEDALSLIEDAK
ncbi:MAG: hypothetical protein ABL930_10160 [Pseudobdellovibrio sp.]